jgi:hypothetical protein
MDSQAAAFTRMGPSDGWVSAACCLAAAAALGLTLQLSDGTQRPDAVIGLGVTLALSGLAVMTPGIGRWSVRVEVVLTALLVIAIAVQLHASYSGAPGQHLEVADPWPYARFYFRLALEALCVGAVLACSERLRRWLVPLLLLTHIPVGTWLMSVSSSPNIDVFIFQHEGAAALLRGENPYAMTFHNVFGHASFYGEGMVQNGRLLFGFPYPPLSLYLSVLGALFGDPRYAQLAAVILAAGLMAYGRGGRLSAGAAALLLLTPRGLLVLQMGWTEPLLIGALAVTVFCACRYPRGLPYALGMLLALKQYTIFVVPLIPLLTPLRGRALWALVWRAGALAFVLTIPFVLINPNAFLWSVVKLQFHQPFRMDALSFLPWWVSRGHAQPPIGVAFGATLLAIALCLWRAPRTPAGFASAVAFVYCTFFAFNKQAFVNYYYFVVGALCIAVAASSKSLLRSSRIPNVVPAVAASQPALSTP